MAKSINSVLLMGNLTRLPAVKEAGTSRVAEFSLALNREYMKDGELMQTVDYIDCVAWGKQVDFIEERLTTGSRVLVQGRFQSRTWDDKTNGQKRSKVEVVVDDLTLTDTKKIEVENG